VNHLHPITVRIHLREGSFAGTCLLRRKTIFTGPKKIDVDGRNYSAKKFVIAIGSRLAVSRDKLIHPQERPQRLIVISGGFFDTMAS